MWTFIQTYHHSKSFVHHWRGERERFLQRARYWSRAQGKLCFKLPSQSERFPVRFPTLAESERGRDEAKRSERNERKGDITDRDREEVSSLRLQLTDELTPFWSWLMTTSCPWQHEGDQEKHRRRIMKESYRRMTGEEWKQTHGEGERRQNESVV